MKLHFDGNQNYQWEAIHAITRLFEGQPLLAGDFGFNQPFGSVQFTENGFGNQLVLTEEQIWENVKSIQETNQVNSKNSELQDMHFSIEMETVQVKHMFTSELFMN